MNVTLIKTSGSRFAAVILGLSICSSVTLGDDTEIYVTESDIACEVNALFVFDTSGSMDAEVLTQETWDPSVVYAGACDSDRIYFTTPGVVPDCDTSQSFPKSRNFCQSSYNRLDASGRDDGRFLTWTGNQRWRELAQITDDQPVECRADAGVSGEVVDDGKVAANGEAGPWSANPVNETGWPARQIAIHDGNWLNWAGSPATASKPKLQIAQEAVINVLNSIDDVNVGLMQFNRMDGGPVIHAVEDIATARESLENKINNLQADGTTPLSETLYEAGQYYAQRLVDYGNNDPANRSVAESRLSGDINSTIYQSPIKKPGERNHIIIMTDGEPANDTDANTRIEALPGFRAATGNPTPACTGAGEGACLDDMAAYLKNRDLRQTIDSDQNVTTHTIGFDIDLPLLQSTADRGGGEYLLATDSASLTAAISKLFQDVNESAGVFAAPSAPVNAFNRSQNAKMIYLSVFEPSNSFHWAGNLKRYELNSGTIDDQTVPNIIDANGRNAVNPDTGLIRDEARSTWSTVTDGNNVGKGGAASLLTDPDSRRLFTNIANPTGTLTVAGNAISKDNPNLDSPDTVGAPNEDERENALDWARGIDVSDEDNDGNTSEPRLSMGDPLHVTPVTLTYGGTDQNPDTVVFVSTNDGYLHAFNAITGEELWAFMPRRLLNRLYELSINNLTPSKQYGLDGEIRLFIRNSDGKPPIEKGKEQALLIFGMRRGGDGIFALDVTDKMHPRLIWEINSDTSSNGKQPFQDLGQSWSTPVVTRVRVGGAGNEDHWVVLFGGGYDTSQDETAGPDTQGNALYMVDLLNGSLLWNAGNKNRATVPETVNLDLEKMNYSIPAGLRVLDTDDDSLADRIYVGDMGGQVWRFDITNGNTPSNLVTGGRLASLGAAGLGDNPPDSQVRRFYNTPDVVPIVVSQQSMLAINIGSGYRAHPLNTDTVDEFFSVRDKRVFGPMTADEYETAALPINRSELVNLTGSSDNKVLVTDNGWRLSMVRGAGEKILNSSITLAGITFFTSFQPLSVNSCLPGGGLNRLYQVSVVDGDAVTNLDGSVDGDDLTDEDRAIVLEQGGIAAGPQVIFTEGPDGITAELLVGAETVDSGDEDDDELSGITNVIRTFWVETEQEQ